VPVGRTAISIQTLGKAANLPEDGKQEMTVMKIITGRRGVLRTPTLTMATSAIGLAWAGNRPAEAAVEPASMFSYRPAPKQVWDNTAIGSPLLNMMRTALNKPVITAG
jgi:hypothetical protein